MESFEGVALPPILPSFARSSCPHPTRREGKDLAHNLLPFPPLAWGWGQGAGDGGRVGAIQRGRSKRHIPPILPTCGRHSFPHKEGRKKPRQRPTPLPSACVGLGAGGGGWGV